MAAACHPASSSGSESLRNQSTTSVRRFSCSQTHHGILASCVERRGRAHLSLTRLKMSPSAAARCGIRDSKDATFAVQSPTGHRVPRESPRLPPASCLHAAKLARRQNTKCSAVQHQLRTLDKKRKTFVWLSDLSGSFNQFGAGAPLKLSHLGQFRRRRVSAWIKPWPLCR